MAFVIVAACGLLASIGFLIAAKWRKPSGIALAKQAEALRVTRKTAAVSAAIFGLVLARVLYEDADSVFVQIAGAVFLTAGVFGLWLTFRLLQASSALSALEGALESEDDISVSYGRRAGIVHLFASPCEIVVRQQNTIIAFESTMGHARPFYRGDADELLVRLTEPHKLSAEIEFPDGRVHIAPIHECRTVFPEMP